MTGDYRTWRADEIAKLRAMARLGIVVLRHELPGRSTRSIYHCARRHGIALAGAPRGNHAGTRWRGKIPVPTHAHPIVRRIYQEANRQRATLTEIAERAGLDRGTIRKWGHNGHPKLPDAIAVLNVLGLDLVIANQQET